MKKKILCLLLVLDVVMTLVPLTALAEETVPEEYWGTYNCTASSDSGVYQAQLILSGNQAKLSIPNCDFDKVFSFSSSTKANYVCIKYVDSSGLSLSLDFDIQSSALYWALCYRRDTLDDDISISDFEKVESTNPSLSKNTVPELFRGTYERADKTGSIFDDDEIIITENQAILNIPAFDFSMTFSLDTIHEECLTFKNKSETLDIFCTDDSNRYLVGFTSGRPEYSPLTFGNCMFVKVSDSTNSTLSTGSELIIPVAAGVVLIGAVIFMGKRKKEETE